MKKLLSYSVIALIVTSCSQSGKEQTAHSEDTPRTEAVAVSEPESKTSSSTTKSTHVAMYPELTSYINSAKEGMEAIPDERKQQLKKIALFVQTKLQSNEPANLTFICTHNSRRSHMSQIWAATAAAYFGIDDNIHTYSGGTEATAFNPRAVAAIKRAGFQIENPGGENPHYKVTFAEDGRELECFSKKYDDPANVQENFAAIMTCSQADKNCPFIPGASLRVPIPYEDPKVADGTAEEAAKYDERCRQIATEMFYLMSQVKA